MEHPALSELINELSTQYPRRYQANTVQVVEITERPTECDICSWKKDPTIILTLKHEMAGFLILNSFRHRKINGVTVLWWV